VGPYAGLADQRGGGKGDGEVSGCSHSPAKSGSPPDPREAVPDPRDGAPFACPQSEDGDEETGPYAIASRAPPLDDGNEEEGLLADVFFLPPQPHVQQPSLSPATPHFRPSRPAVGLGESSSARRAPGMTTWDATNPGARSGLPGDADSAPSASAVSVAWGARPSAEYGSSVV